jgi:Ca2+-binding EF-hand superfamily protein
MKKSALFLLLCLIPLACVTSPAGEDPEARRQLDGLMEHWLTALRERNIDAFMEAYWPEAEKVILQRDGGEIVLRGPDRIREQQANTFESFEGFRELNYMGPERELHGNAASYHYQVEGPGIFFIEHFDFERREGRWAIMHQVIDMRAERRPEGMAGLPAEGREPPRVASDFQAWADGNRNGVLEPPELQELLEAVRLLVSDVHAVRTPVDECFDFNRDGEVGILEKRQAQLILFREQPRRFYQYDPDLARQFDPVERHPQIILWEAERLLQQVIDPRLRLPREASDPLDRKIDRNGDGRLDNEELEAFTRRLFVVCALMPLEEVKPVLEASSKREIFDYVDLNGNGILEVEWERHDLLILASWVLSNPDRIVFNPMDAYFDRNRDSRVGIAELETAREQLVIAPLENYYQIHAEGAEKFIDLNHNGRIEGQEIGAIIEAIFGPEPFWTYREDYDVPEQLVELLDRNGDGRVGYDGELERLYEGEILFYGAYAWLEAPQEGEEGWAVASALDELSDLNGNGVVEPEEDVMAREGLRGPHPVGNAFDRRIDFNGDGEVSALEIMRARRAGEIREPSEDVELRSLPVSTRIDGFLDLNGDDRVEEDEIETVVRAFLQPADSRFPGRWTDLLDLNRDGRISREELIESRERYLRAHPADPDSRLDRELDRDRDGFVAPEEIGIAAGYTEGRRIPSFDERLEQLGWREEQRAVSEASVERPRYESEYYKKLGTIQDKKLAVVGINSGTKSVNEETATGVMVFIEHAFVNVGKVRVVDRQNIAKIVKEYEFQASELTDESTAVEIGKLSGADIIVIGSISYVGDNYYLNIKLISVETAEIIGSSIADAKTANEFYEMCNEAVYKLF